MNYLDLLKEQFNHQVALREKRPGIMQLVVPLFHEDGDMVDIFLEDVGNGEAKVRVSDYGMTLMRLSYGFDIDTENKERIFQRILSEHGLNEANGRIFVDTTPESLYPAILQFAQTIAKVSNMETYKREVIKSLFYEMLEEVIDTSFKEYHPRPKTLPLPERDELEVDYEFDVKARPLFLFGVKDNAKARLVTISCLEFQRANVPFKSFVVHEDFDALTRKDRSRITSAVDKQFVSLDDFRDNGPKTFAREVA
jgi:hypothetical protein